MLSEPNPRSRQVKDEIRIDEKDRWGESEDTSLGEKPAEQRLPVCLETVKILFCLVMLER